MSDAKWSAPTRRPLPLILIRGFGGIGIEDEKRVAYQGFNEGTVYPNKRGDNYIYEGMIIKFMKSAWQYQDATNVVGYFPTPMVDSSGLPHSLRDLPDDFFYQPAGSDASVEPLYKVVIDPGMALTIRDRQKTRDPTRTLWVFRYYDLNDRTFQLYGRVLVRLIDFIRGLAGDGGGPDSRDPQGQHHRALNGRADRPRGDPAQLSGGRAESRRLHQQGGDAWHATPRDRVPGAEPLDRHRCEGGTRALLARFPGSPGQPGGLHETRRPFRSAAIPDSGWHKLQDLRREDLDVG